MGPYLFEDNSGNILIIMAGYFHMIEKFPLYSWQVILNLVKEHGFKRTE
jgi:hypothetical protein